MGAFIKTCSELHMEKTGILAPDLILHNNSSDLISQTVNVDAQFWWDGAKQFNWDSALSLFPWYSCQTLLCAQFKLPFVLSPLQQELALIAMSHIRATSHNVHVYLQVFYDFTSGCLSYLSLD